MFLQKKTSDTFPQYTITQPKEAEIEDSIEVLPIQTTTVIHHARVVWMIFVFVIFFLALLLSLFVLFQGFSQSI